MLATHGPSNPELNSGSNHNFERMGFGVAQRPTKSAANKYRNIAQGNAIQEESYYEGQVGYMRRGNILNSADDESI